MNDKIREELRKERVTVFHKMRPFVSASWILEKFGFTKEEIAFLDKDRRDEFIAKIAAPNTDISESDERVLNQIFKKEGEPDRRAGPSC